MAGTHTKFIASALKGAEAHGRNLTFDETGDKILEGKEFSDP